MSVERRVCVWITCDDPECGNRSEDGWEEGVPHFESEQEALDYAIGEAGCGWTKRPDGRLLCRSCSAAADCEATGHRFVEWRVAPTDDEIEWRFCTHCGGGFEERLVAAGPAQQSTEETQP